MSLHADVERIEQAASAPLDPSHNGHGAHESAPSGPYHVADGRICRDKQTKDGVVTVPLCNFAATIEEEVVLDDGAESTRAFMVTGALDTGRPLPSARVPAAKFASMNWVTEAWGVGAIINAGTSSRDALREAIQRFSLGARRRQVFTHTGWRQIAGRWLFLSGSGALGGDGVEVDLGPELARYQLPVTPESAREAMRASLALLRLGPLAVTAPLLAAMYRAPLTSVHPLDVSVWIEGQTGSGKSTITALFLSHFGPFDRLHLPGAWSSTANQLERRAFLLKDLPFVIDDYAPSALDARELESKAARLLRAQGNHAGRGRLRADLSERPAYPPRGFIIATGEQHPAGQSVLARTLVVPLERDMIDLSRLSEAQGQHGGLAHAMAGYLSWLAPQMETLPVALAETFTGARRRATVGREHLRIPEALAHLWLGVDCALAYAQDIGACTSGEASDIRGACWSALVELGRAQGAIVSEERPAVRFLRALLALITQRRVLVLPVSELDVPAESTLIGYQDDASLYLLPDPAYHAVARFCRDGGEPLTIRQERIRKELANDGVIEADAGHLTTTARVGGRVRRVLRVNLTAAARVLGEDFPPVRSRPVTDVTGCGE